MSSLGTRNCQYKRNHTFSPVASSTILHSGTLICINANFAAPIMAEAATKLPVKTEKACQGRPPSVSKASTTLSS